MLTQGSNKGMHPTLPLWERVSLDQLSCITRPHPLVRH